jgi:beta-N-acetylhexosaminidase
MDPRASSSKVGPMRRTQLFTTAIIAALVTICSACAAARPGQAAPAAAPGSGSAVAATLSPGQRTGCEAGYLARFTPRQRLAQLLTVGVTGPLDAITVERTQQVGGIFIGSWTDQSLLTDHLLGKVAAAGIVAPMVTIDEEGGRVSRVRNLIGPAPSAREMARTMTTDEVYQLFLQRGRQLRDFGITVDFAPDTDVSDQPDNDVIGDRSFSDDPGTVARYAAAAIRGLHDAGVQAVIKHFPGHGHGSGDSHKSTVTTPPLEQLRQVDLVPFRELVNSGAAVMVGHLDVPGLTQPGFPASISAPAMALLRDGAGYGAPPFNGVIFTDDLGGMVAITSRMDIQNAVLTALLAGADDALWITDQAVPAVLDRLQQAEAVGLLNPLRVDDSVLRVGRYKGTLTC